MEASLAVSSIGEEVSEKVSTDQNRRSQKDITLGNCVAYSEIQQVVGARPVPAGHGQWRTSRVAPKSRQSRRRYARTIAPVV